VSTADADSIVLYNVGRNLGSNIIGVELSANGLVVLFTSVTIKT